MSNSVGSNADYREIPPPSPRDIPGLKEVPDKQAEDLYDVPERARAGAVTFDDSGVRFSRAPSDLKIQLLTDDINYIKPYISPIVHKRLLRELSGLQNNHISLNSTVHAKRAALSQLTSKLASLEPEDRGIHPQITAKIIQYKNDKIQLQAEINEIEGQIKVNDDRLQHLKDKVVRYAKIHSILRQAPIDGARVPPVALRQGAVKQVWIKDNRVQHAFYTALHGNKSAVAELQSEVEIAQDIQRKLDNKSFKEFILQFFGDTKDYELSSSGYHILLDFESIGALQEAINKNSDLLQGVPPRDIELIKRCFNSIQGQAAVKKAAECGQNLAIDLKVLQGEERIKDAQGNYQFTVQAPLADEDLESLLRDPSAYTKQDLVNIMVKLTKGMADLQDAGYVHGDLKPENVLVRWNKETQQYDVKVSDWGKAKSLTHSNQVLRLQGNTRFAPWEFQTSKAGEVCGIGIQLIRILEQHLLEKDREVNPSKRSLVEPARRGLGKAAQSTRKNRQGFEVFAIESADFNAIEANRNWLQTLLHRIYHAINFIIPNSAARKARMASEKDRYIDALEAQLKSRGFASSEETKVLCQLIKDMTHIDPSKRPTMRAAAAQLEQLQPSLLGRQL